MGFTDKCDIFAAFHEDGFNRIIDHVVRQRPSLVNYATQYVYDHPDLFCRPIRPHEIVAKRGNPIATIEDPLAIPGTPYGLNFCAQITRVRIDFHPGNQFNLPPELSPPLGAQRFAINLEFCAGLGCPPKDIVDKYVPLPPDPSRKDRDPKATWAGKDDRKGNEPKTEPPAPLIPLPTRELLCFCLQVFVTGTVRIREYYQKPYLEFELAGLEIVDIKPTPLENAIECYLSAILRLSVLPGLRVLLEDATFDLKESLDNLKKSVFVKITPTPAPAPVAHNPAIEDDQVKVFGNVEVI